MDQAKDGLIHKAERKINWELSDAKAITHHIPQVDQCPANFQATTILKTLPNLLFVTAEYDIIWHWTSLWLSCLCPLPTLCLPMAYSGLGCWEKEKTLTLCKQFSATAKTLVSYQHCFSHKFKAQPHRRCYESELHPCQMQYSSPGDQCKSSNECKEPAKEMTLFMKFLIMNSWSWFN